MSAAAIAMDPMVPSMATRLLRVARPDVVAGATCAPAGQASHMHDVAVAHVWHVSPANAYHAWDLESTFQTFIVAIKDRLHRRPEERSP